MPSNPFDDPEFLPTVIRVAAALGAGLIIVVLIELLRHRPLRDSVLLARVKTWLVIGPIFTVAIFTGGFVVFLLALFIVLQALVEYGRLVRLQRRYLIVLIVGTVASLAVAADAIGLGKYLVFMPLVFFMVLTLMPIATGQIDQAHRQTSISLFGFLYVGLAMATFVLVYGSQRWGPHFLMVVGVAVAASDVMAFVLGSALKGPKLAPKVSPNKTWSGFAGNLIGAALGVALMSNLIPEVWPLYAIVIVTLAIGVGAVWGDLTESFLKRDYEVKDAGTLLPGFGGILDRIDSLLLALPLSYFALLIALRIFD